MKNLISRKTLFAGLLSAACLAAGMSSAMAAEQPIHIRGTIGSVTAAGFTVQTDNGMKTIALNANTRITGVVPSSLDKIKPGTFIGTANVAQRGQNRALEVVVFPASMKGTGLGNYPWDLSPQSGESSSMTNGTVKPSAMTNGTVKISSMGSKAMSGSAMTNGTVKRASSNGPMKLVVDYGKGEKTITVPKNVPVVTFQPADKSAIVKGAHVFVAGKPGSTVDATMVAVGLNGTVPPM